MRRRPPAQGVKIPSFDPRSRGEGIAAGDGANARAKSMTLFVEFIQFLRQEKKWWLIPLGLLLL
ncbi:MAG: DUF5989 family protein, partial [Thermoanaerobaculia bacterium]